MSDLGAIVVYTLPDRRQLPAIVTGTAWDSERGDIADLEVFGLPSTDPSRFPQEGSFRDRDAVEPGTWGY